MPLIEPPVFIGPALTATASPQQRGIVMPDHDRLVDPSFRQTVALKRTSSAVLGLRIEEAGTVKLAGVQAGC